MVPQQRGRILRDEAEEYAVSVNGMEGELNHGFTTQLDHVPLTDF
jgi:hypothetical protein